MKDVNVWVTEHCVYNYCMYTDSFKSTIRNSHPE